MNEKSLIKNYLCDDFEHSYKIYNDKLEYYSSLYDRLLKIKNFIEKFYKDKLDSWKIKEEIYSTELIDENYDRLIKLIREEIIINIKGSLSVINDILTNLLNAIEKIKTNIKNFSDYIQLQNTFNSKLIELDDIQKKYHQSAEKAELFTIEFFEKKINDKKTDKLDFSKKNQLQGTTKELKDKYINKISVVNDSLKTFNEKQKFIFNINKEIKVSIYENYINSLFSFYQFASDKLEEIEEKKDIKQKIIKLTNEKEKLSLIEYRDINKIVFIQYETKMDFNHCYDTKEIATYIIVGEEMKNNIGDYIKEDLEQCRVKVELKIKIRDVLNLDEKITNKDKELIESITNNDIGQSAFIHCLSQLRTNGKLNKSKIFIEFMGKILNKIIESQKRKNEYKYMKSVLILSQTYYYLNISKEKKYIFEYIENNKWLISPKFWRNFIDVMLTQELNKRINISEINRNDLLFTQMISFVKNMKEFNIDNRIIIKIIDELMKKFNYTDLKSVDGIFAMIIKDENEIKKLRKEYQDNPDLEKQLYKEE